MRPASRRFSVLSTRGCRRALRRSAALSRALPKTSFAPKPVAKPASAPFAAAALSAESSGGEPVTYQRKTSMEEAAHSTDKLYEPYAVQTIAIDDAKPHPTALVQSASMASVAPPMPSYVPRLPRNLVTEGILSDAQIETIIYAGEAHQSFLAGHYKADESFDRLDRVAPGGRRRGAVPQGLFSWRRHGLRQGPAGGWHCARQLAARPPPRALDFEIRQASRRCAARLVGARPGETPDRAANPHQAGPADQAPARDTLHHLRDLAKLRPRREELPPPANSRLARDGFRRRDPVR